MFCTLQNFKLFYNTENQNFLSQINRVMAPKRGMPPGIHSQARAEFSKKAQNARRNWKMKGKTVSPGNK